MQYIRNVIRQIICENVMTVKGGMLLNDFPEYKVNKPINISKALSDPENVELRFHVWNILEFSYESLGGNIYSQPDDLINHGLNEFLAFDVTGDGLPNVIFSGWKSKRSSYNMIKSTMSGTDGMMQSTAFYKKELVRRINSGEAFHEVSGGPAAILMKAGARPLNKEQIEKYFPRPKRTWYGKHPEPNSRDAKNAEKYGPSGEYDMWVGRMLFGNKPIVKLFFGKMP